MAIYNLTFSPTPVAQAVGTVGENTLTISMAGHSWSLNNTNTSVPVSSGTFTNDGNNNLILSDNMGTVSGTNDTSDGAIWTYTDVTTPADNNIDTGMGSTYYEEDLTTNVKKYFAEAFKFDGSQFVMDGDRIVGLKQSFIDTLAIDLTNIVNTSITTATLEADNATINDTLTALGIDVTGLLKAKGLEVGSDGLTIEDMQGHKHKFHLGN